MPQPKVLIRQETKHGFTYFANHCRWWPEFWDDVFTKHEYNMLLLLRHLIETGRVHEDVATLDRHGTGLAVDRLLGDGGRFAGRIGKRQ